ncbi:MAG: hypothetical protein K0R50_1496 [Eubacterium sp.]|jgi:hypothetical protein|nr:hypothetical protein [Eubacterium sp.]
MGRKRKKDKHSHSKKTTFNKPESGKIKDEKIDENNFESDYETRKKHKCKKNDFEHLTILDGLLILLLLKEIGYLDDDKTCKDQYKEFGENIPGKVNGKGQFDFDAFEKDSYDM